MARGAKRGAQAALGLAGSLSLRFTSSAVTHRFTPELIRRYREAHRRGLGIHRGNAPRSWSPSHARRIVAPLSCQPVPRSRQAFRFGQSRRPARRAARIDVGRIGRRCAASPRDMPCDSGAVVHPRQGPGDRAYGDRRCGQENTRQGFAQGRLRGMRPDAQPNTPPVASTNAVVGSDLPFGSGHPSRGRATRRAGAPQLRGAP